MKTRTELELLIVLRDNFDKYFTSGLCSLITKLYIRSNFITHRERVILDIIISKYKPNSLYHNIFIKDGDYYWKAGKVEPRKRFIDKLIKIHSDEKDM